MKKILESVGAAIMKIVFSRKFIALAVVLLLGWRAFDAVLASENPFAWILFALVCVFLVIALGVYAWANIKAKLVTPPAT